jgi:hypothetical protein
MKNLLVCLLLLTLGIQSALADCDWNTIVPGPNKTFIYPESCHLRVGQLVEGNSTQAQQIQDLTKAISLKNLALQDSDSRVLSWQKTSNDEFDRLSKIESDQKHNDFLYFGLGILSSVAIGFTVARLTR